ncbi:MAG: efflux RND transporter permease subunit, partial [Mesorhizobium sp.]
MKLRPRRLWPRTERPPDLRRPPQMQARSRYDVAAQGFDDRRSCEGSDDPDADEGRPCRPALFRDNAAYPCGYARPQPRGAASFPGRPGAKPQPTAVQSGQGLRPGESIGRGVRVMVNFFIHRPIFASSIAIIMMLAGAICYFLLPVSQFPDITPPQVVV